MVRLIIKRILLIVIPILLLSISSCTGKMRLTILFDKDPGIEKRAPVILEEKVIGEVKDVKLKGGKTAVVISILPDYKRTIREESRFYLRSWTGKPCITVLVFDKSSPRMKSGLTLLGYPEYRFWIDKGIGELKEVKQSLDDFFKSDEWKSFKVEMKEKIEKGTEEGKKFFEENLPKLREELQEIYTELEEEYGEEAREKAKEYVDSLIEEKR